MTDFMKTLAACLGPGGMMTDAAETASFGADWRGLYAHAPRAVLRPSTTEQVAAVVRLCAEARAPIVPQGGNTSMVAGAIPSEPDTQFVLSLARLNRIRSVDRAGMTMVAEAGVIVQHAQNAAADSGMLFPLSIGSEGSATIGGIIATNAGGNNTLRFGNARDLMLGLEVVLPDGRVWNGLRALRKDNTGYALRHLFAGSEGTLGIITAAAIKLAPAPRERQTCLCALPSLDAVLDLFARFRDEDETALYAFEYISGAAMALNERHMPGFRLPLANRAPHYALAELATTRRHGNLRESMDGVLVGALDDGTIDDAVIAESEAQRTAFRAIREHLSEAQKREGYSVKNDISVPLNAIPDLFRQTETLLAERYAGCRLVAFGHIGDGNIHLNMMLPDNADTKALGAALMTDINAIVASLGGSFSAEHGIGLVKRKEFQRWRDEVERGTMEKIRTALDPDAIFNPGKVF